MMGEQPEPAGNGQDCRCAVGAFGETAERMNRLPAGLYSDAMNEPPLSGLQQRNQFENAE